MEEEREDGSKTGEEEELKDNKQMLQLQAQFWYVTVSSVPIKKFCCLRRPRLESVANRTGCRVGSFSWVVAGFSMLVLVFTGIWDPV